MMTLTMAGQEHKVDHLTHAHTLFVKLRKTRSSEEDLNDGLVRIDGKPAYVFSFNGRLWNALPHPDDTPVHYIPGEIEVLRSMFT